MKIIDKNKKYLQIIVLNRFWPFAIRYCILRGSVLVTITDMEKMKVEERVFTAEVLLTVFKNIVIARYYC